VGFNPIQDDGFSLKELADVPGIFLFGEKFVLASLALTGPPGVRDSTFIAAIVEAAQ
jgi:hypothetical protein